MLHTAIDSKNLLFKRLYQTVDIMNQRVHQRKRPSNRHQTPAQSIRSRPIAERLHNKYTPSNAPTNNLLTNNTKALR
jgi:hypothetical protein